MYTTRAKDSLQAELAEVEQLLERWSFSFSATGFIYARPRRPSLDAKELAGFIDRLRLICETDYPDAIVFDLCDAAIAEPQWPPMETLLREFARSINARLRIVSAHCWPAAVAIVYRRGRGLAAELRRARSGRS
jgi:hypothetical protein